MTQQQSTEFDPNDCDFMPIPELDLTPTSLHLANNIIGVTTVLGMVDMEIIFFNSIVGRDEFSEEIKQINKIRLQVSAKIFNTAGQLIIKVNEQRRQIENIVTLLKLQLAKIMELYDMLAPQMKDLIEKYFPGETTVKTTEAVCVKWKD